VGAEASLTGAMTPGMASAMPVSQFVPAIVAAQPAPQQVYRDPVVPATRSTARRSSAPRARTASNSTYGAAEPSYSRGSAVEPVQQGRSWKKSAIIIGGSTAAGAGVGAVMGGKKGAVKGGVVGLVGGTIYDIATRNKH